MQQEVPIHFSINFEIKHIYSRSVIALSVLQLTCCGAGGARHFGLVPSRSHCWRNAPFLPSSSLLRCWLLLRLQLTIPTVHRYVVNWKMVWSNEQELEPQPPVFIRLRLQPKKSGSGSRTLPVIREDLPTLQDIWQFQCFCVFSVALKV